MAAPSGIKWGSIVTGSKSTRKGRIGIYAGVTETATQVKVNIQVWFWSMYSVDDSNNSYYYNTGSTTATTLIGSRDINHTVASGSGWSTSNQTKLGETNYTYNKGTSSSTKYYAAKLTGIDTLYSSSVMTVSTSVTVPALASYKIAYNANGGSGAPGSQTKYYGKNITLSSTKPTRPGHNFQGWSTANDSSVEYAAGATYSGNAALTLYAVWKANTYTVSYNANGGSGAPSSQTKTYGVNLTLSSTKPTRENYDFKGWATSSNGAVVYSAGGSYTSNAAVTLYAVWELAYVIPRIIGLTASRCDKDGNASKSGTYAKVSFNWATDKAVSSIKIEWKRNSDTSWSSATVSASGTSGTVTNKLIGDGSISTDYAYTIRVTVADASGSNNNSITVSGQIFPIDVYLGIKGGVAFGKTAEKEGIFEVNYPAEFNKILQPISGMRVHMAGGTAGTTGYVKIATINITGVYLNQSIEMTIAQRGKWNPATLHINFNGGNTTDPSSVTLLYTSYQYYDIYIVKSATSTWDLYIAKTEGYDNIAILDFKIGDYADQRLNLTWKDEQASSVPTGYTKANNGLYANVLNSAGGTLTGNVTLNRSSATDATWFKVTNGNGSVSLHVSTNRGLYDETNGRWIIYNYKAKNVIAIPTSLYCHNTSGVPIHLIGISDSNNCYLNYDNYNNSTGSLNLYTADYIHIYTKKNDNVSITGRSLQFKGVYTAALSVSCMWADNALHDIIGRASNGLTSYFGPGSLGSSYKTTTNLRGYYVRLYAHSGGAVYLGSSGSTAVTSDRNLKKDIYDLNDKYVTFFNNLRPITYKYSESGHRDHIGFIAQEVEEALEKAELTSEEFAGLVIDKDITLNPNHDSSLSDEENKLSEIHYDKLYSLRYEEFIALNTHMIQKQQAKIQSLESEVTSLKDELAKLKELVNTLVKSA